MFLVPIKIIVPLNRFQASEDVEKLFNISCFRLVDTSFYGSLGHQFSIFVAIDIDAKGGHRSLYKYLINLKRRLRTGEENRFQKIILNSLKK
jgi:hypothetical protein